LAGTAGFDLSSHLLDATLAVEEAVKWAPRLPDNMIAGRPGFEYHIANLVLRYTWEVIVYA
jgi:hypothetical protein